MRLIDLLYSSQRKLRREAIPAIVPGNESLDARLYGKTVKTATFGEGYLISDGYVENGFAYYNASKGKHKTVLRTRDIMG